MLLKWWLLTMLLETWRLYEYECLYRYPNGWSIGFTTGFVIPKLTWIFISFKTLHSWLLLLLQGISILYLNHLIAAGISVIHANNFFKITIIKLQNSIGPYIVFYTHSRDKPLDRGFKLNAQFITETLNFVIRYWNSRFYVSCKN